MFDKAAWIRLPRHVVVGHDVIEQLGEAIEELHLDGPALVVTSPTPRELVGDRIRSQLEAAGAGPAELITVETASFEAVERIVEAGEDGRYLVGVGGGKPIDLAKLASDHLGIGFVSIPTAASHDGIASGRASIPEGDIRHSVAADPPMAVVADTGLIAEAPWELTTAGCADIISNYTAVTDWRLAHRLRHLSYSEYAAALSEMTAEILVENAPRIKPGLEESAWIVVKALVSSGVAMSIASSSRPASGAEHLISHRLDQLVPGRALHGHQVGVASILTAYLQSGEEGDWQRIRDALRAIGAPVTAEGLELSEEELLEAMTSAHRIRDRYTILGDGITEAAAHEAAVVTGVI